MNCAMISSQHSCCLAFKNVFQETRSYRSLHTIKREEIKKNILLETKLVQIQTPWGLPRDIYLENDEISLREEPLDKVDITTHKNGIVIDSPIRKNNLEMELDNELDIVEE